MGDLENLTAENFDSTLSESTTPVLVDFWAEWCAPCDTVLPVLEEIATEQEGKLRVTKLNTVEHPEIAERFAIKSVPTLMIFRSGEVQKTIFGARNKRQLMVELGDLIS